MRFADFHEGMTADIGPATLTEQEIIEFARHYDPQWFHTDPDRAANGWHGGLSIYSAFGSSATPN